MYVANGNKAGFWVKRNSGTVAFVTHINGKSEGTLEGEPPYYGNQKVIGKIGGKSGVEISCAGTYGYELLND